MSRILRDFILMYLFGVVIVAVMVWLIQMFFLNYSDSSNVMGILIPMFAAMQVGQSYYKRTGTALSGGFAIGGRTQIKTDKRLAEKAAKQQARHG